ncbi:MAG: Asp-tRNA(Asn)/Glu-tRNA(Gln) amidotransferase subunit GatC [Candidatus Eisenbacteria bacterium]|nr:Asp-tRNA(Asn)/Glu-tRNA(Gln) amidotransferase subunit GatC [Candidatus Eisenbacteria bacterium]
MAIDRAEALRIAALARLHLPAGEEDAVARQLSQVLDFVATLDELDLSSEAATVLTPADAEPRVDAPDGRMLDAERATAQAPESEHGFFLVPPVVESLEP